MARALRIESPGTYQHILSRGNERKAIFQDNRDYERFLELLRTLSERFNLEIWSYVLMGNHYHLLLKTREANLSCAMQWLGVSYSTWYNKRHGRSGHLFQGRFKSFIIEEAEYLYQLILYMHRNPLRAGIVRRLADYRWSSYRCLAYGTNCCEWFDREVVLGLFGKNEERFRREVQRYSEKEDRLLENLLYGIILGSKKAAEKLRVKLSKESLHREKPQGKRLVGTETVEGCIEGWKRVLGISEVEMEKLRRPIRGRERVLRDVLIYQAWKEGSFKLSDIGRYFNVGYTSVVNARIRSRNHLKKTKHLREKLVRPRANDK